MGYFGGTVLRNNPRSTIVPEEWTTVKDVPPIFVSVAEAARIINVSRWSMYELTKRGDVASTREGSRISVNYKALKAYAKTLTVKTEALQ